MAQMALQERDLLEAVLSRYEAAGFQVYMQPPPSVLPEFMGGFRPDAVAIKGEKQVAIEIAHSGADASRITEVQKLFQAHPDWDLNIVYLSPRASAVTLEAVSRSAIEQSISDVEQLRSSGLYAAALMLGWSALEAIGRAILPERLQRPQPTTSLVETLANEGLLTPAEANVVRRIAAVRNSSAHGLLYPNPAPKRVDELLAVLHTLSELLPKDAVQ